MSATEAGMIDPAKPELALELTLEDIHTYYGSHYVLQGLSLELPRGSVTALLGRNGTGKTTTIHSIIGFTPPRRGTIRLRGEAIEGLSPYRVARRGIALVPQGKRLFPSLTVRECLALAARGEGWTLDRVCELFPVLRERQGVASTLLSGGEQQMLSLGRALMTNPSVLLLDELSEGLAPMIVRELGAIVGRLKGEGMTILLAEQNLELALGVADTVCVLDMGRVAWRGSAGELRADAALQARLLGV